MMNKEDYEVLRDSRGATATLQQRAAANPLKSVWVEASAGTGKTKVLSDRVLRLLLNGVKPQRLLCLTYTKAAAVQMKSRISERLSEWSVISDEKLEKNLYDLLGDEITSPEDLRGYKQTARTLFAVMLDTPGGVKIQTIHSFCQEILKRFPIEAGISPYFAVMEENASNDALAQISREMLAGTQSGVNSPVAQALQYLTTNVSEYSFPNIMKDIVSNRVKIAALRQKYPDNTALVKALEQSLSVDSRQTEETVKAEFMAGIDAEKMRKAVLVWQSGTKINQTRSEIIGEICANGFNKEDYDAFQKAFMRYTNFLCSKQDEATQNFLQIVLLRLQSAESTIKKLKLFAGTMAFLTLADELNSKYTEYKQKHSCLDFADEISITHKLLSDLSVASWVLYKLDGGIDHILLDEAQDTSPEQWDIIKALSSEFFAGQGASGKLRTVFVVGDRKQSIFSFQGADPEKFDKMSHYFAEVGGDNFAKVNLEVSFRSSSAILDTVNRLFAKPEVAAGVTAEGETVNHLPFRAGEAGHVEIWPLTVAEADTQDDDTLPSAEMSKNISSVTKLAQAVAQKIKTLRAESLQNAKPLNFSDFMVLVQTRSGFVDEFVRACKNIGVNVSGADRLQLSKQIAVQDMISLGEFLLLPNNDLVLAEVLKSPLFGLTDDDLITLCYGRGKAPLWSRLGDFPQYAEIYKSLQNLFNMLDFVRPFELYNYVLTKMNGRLKFTERMGVEVEDALDEFINLTISYEHDNIPSLQGFIEWISGSSVEVKRETEQSDTDAVRLMTVHHSKGLQAPIVFLPDAMRLKKSTRGQTLLWDEGMAYYPLSKDLYDEKCEAVSEKNKQKSIEEYRRLMYVALTRAEDRLYICGYARKDEAAADSWYKLCHRCLQEYGIKENEKIIWDEPEVIAKNQKDRQFSIGDEIAPESWIYQEVAPESPLARPYTPSRPEEDDTDSKSPLEDSGNFYRRGTLIHKLLQFLPQTAGDKAQIIGEYLAKNAADFSLAQRQQICNEVLTLLHNPDFAVIFGEHSRAEVPIIGESNGKIVSAQLDRLIILPEKIMIVDFKTNRPAAANVATTPDVYKKQLATYADLIAKIYGNLPIETYILWTNETRLMRVS
jgi:ATP-dependent helicase/nuclease subunit A